MQLQCSLLRQTRQALEAALVKGTPDKVADLVAALLHSDRSSRLDALAAEAEPRVAAAVAQLKPQPDRVPAEADRRTAKPVCSGWPCGPGR